MPGVRLDEGEAPRGAAVTALRILVTGSRGWRDREPIRSALVEALGTYATVGLPILVHGNAPGADLLASLEWSRLMSTREGDWLARPEFYNARDFPTPLARNAHMVSLGATVCLAFALSWRSGTGNCARLARRAGIHTIDYGADTRQEARP